MSRFQKLILVISLLTSSNAFSQEYDLKQLLAQASDVVLKNYLVTRESSGIDLRAGKVVSDQQADAFVAQGCGNDKKCGPIALYIPVNQTNGKSPNTGGVAYAILTSDKISCPLNQSVYSDYPWYEVNEKAYYCLKTRDGSMFGIIRVNKILDDGLNITLVAVGDKLGNFESTGPAINLN